jgi:hypothetical protein
VSGSRLEVLSILHPVEQVRGMATLWYSISLRDNSATGLGARLTGLKPSWALLKLLADNSDVIPQPAIVEVGQGLYKFSYDAEAQGDAVGQINILGGGNPGSLTLNPADQYVDVTVTRESSRLISGINSSGQVTLSPSGIDAIAVETGVNARQALSPILAASAGVLLGAGTGTIVVKGGNSSVTRITATSDNAGNRTAVSLTLPQ